jgi:hypothetical protein
MSTFNYKRRCAMNKLLTVVASGLVILTASNLFATPSTQIWIPSTDIQGFLKPHIGWDAYLGTETDGIISDGGLTMGVLPFKKVGMEVGLDYIDGIPASGNHRNPIYFNAKLGLPEDGLFKYMPAVVVGGYNFGTKKDATTYNIGYALIAKNIWKLGRFSVGGFKGAIGSDPKLFAVSADSKTNDDKGVLASWDRTMSEISNNLWLAIDFQSGKSTYGALSFGAAWSFSPIVSIIAGYDIYNNDAYKPTFTFQVDINAF